MDNLTNLNDLFMGKTYMDYVSDAEKKALEREKAYNQMAYQEALGAEASARTRKSDALLPFDIAKMQFETSPEMQGLNKRKLGAETSKLEADTREALNKLSDEELMQGFKQSLQVNRAWMTQAYQQLQSGLPTSSVIDSVLANIPEDKLQDKSFLTLLDKYRNYPPQRAASELLRGIQAIQQQEAQNDPTYWRDKMNSIIQAQSRMATAGAEKPTDYARILQAVKTDPAWSNRSPKEQAEEASRIYSGRSAGGQPATETKYITTREGTQIPIGGKTKEVGGRGGSTGAIDYRQILGQ